MEAGAAARSEVDGAQRGRTVSGRPRGPLGGRSQPTVDGPERRALDDACLKLLAPDCRHKVEDLLPQLPRCDNEDLLDLIDAELCRRQELGESPGHEEYAARFPRLDPVDLRRLFEVHQIESGGQQRSSPPPYELPGMRLGAVVVADDNSEVRRARRVRAAKWISVRVFASQQWSPEQRRQATKLLAQSAAFSHRHILPSDPPRVDPDGRLFSALEAAEGTPLRKRLRRAMTGRDAARYLLPLVGAVELARQQGIWLGEIEPEHLIIDHFDRLCLLGFGGLSFPNAADVAGLDDPGRSRLGGTELENAPETAAAEAEPGDSTIDSAGQVLTLGRLWEQMTCAEATDTIRGIGAACRDGVYATPGDFASDLDALQRGVKGAWQRGASSRWRLWS